MHKQKIQHGEFNQRCDWLLATSSNDRTVKLWDVRMIRKPENPKQNLADGYLHTLVHEAPVDSGKF